MRVVVMNSTRSMSQLPITAWSESSRVLQPSITTLSRSASPWLRSRRSLAPKSSSFVTITPPSPQTLRFLSGCKEKPPASPKVAALRSPIAPRMHWQESSMTGSLCRAAISISAGISVIWPAKWTGMIALVRGVIAAASLLTSMQKLSVQSTSTGRAKFSAIAPMVAMNVFAAVLDRLGARRDRRRELAHVHAEIVGAVDEYRPGEILRDRADGRDERIRRRDDLVARSDAERLERELESIGARVHADGVTCADQAGKALLEFPHRLAQGEVTGRHERAQPGENLLDALLVKLAREVRPLNLGAVGLQRQVDTRHPPRSMLD